VRLLFFVISAVLSVAPLKVFAAEPAPIYACNVGAYRLLSREYVFITPSTPDTLRYRLYDGRSGRLYPKDHNEFYSGAGWSEKEPIVATARFEPCTDKAPSRRLDFSLMDGPHGFAKRVAIPKKAVHFTSGGVDLYGELYRPPAGRPGALVVLIFGSGGDSATTYNYLQYMLPLKGIATFVYDKRGTGPSGGKLSANFDELANDAVAAMNKARELLNDSNVPVGFMGESQGGWIAPLAATRTPTDFVVVGYGLAISPLDESREQITRALRSKGYGDDVVGKAMQLTDLTARIIATHFQEGMDELQQLKAQYAHEPWLKDVQGDFTGPFLDADDAQLAKLREAFAMDISMYYDPKPVLNQVKAPMLWVLGGKDEEAPSDTTLAFLKELQPQSPQLDIAVFPNADHGIIEFEEINGERRSSRIAEGYHDLIVQWMLTRSLRGKFGTAVLLRDQPDQRAASTR
jgi:uncharacterized protein